jgi:hypothetical protein
MAGPTGSGFSCLQGFSQVILMDEADLASSNYDLYFLGHCRLLVLVLAQPELLRLLFPCWGAVRRVHFSRRPKVLFGASGLLLIKIGLLLDGLRLPQSRLNALGQVLTGGPFDTGDVNIHLAVLANDEFDFLHGQYFLKVITVSCVAGSILSL